VKQILFCSKCNFKLSDTVNVLDSKISDYPHPRMGGWETSVAEKGICFHSKVDIIDASKAFQVLRDETNKKRGLPFLKRKVPSFTLGEIEEAVKTADIKAEYICFSHLRFAPQYWLSIVDVMFHLETKEHISWGWEGTNTPNVFCPNCDIPVGTEIAYTENIPDTFIPNNETTKWQNEKS